jgi:hypothetical protein
MKLIFIYGPPAVGKLTVANELAALTGYKVFHNHVTVDLALGFFEFGSRGFGRLVDAVRMLMFEVAATEKLDGLIFTFVYGAPHDDPFIERVLRVVEGKGGEVCFVQLFCDPPVLEERVVQPERACYKKLASVEVLRELVGRHELFSPVPFRESLCLDTTYTPPRELAETIAAAYGLGSEAG